MNISMPYFIFSSPWEVNIILLQQLNYDLEKPHNCQFIETEIFGVRLSVWIFRILGLTLYYYVHNLITSQEPYVKVK